MKITVEYDNVSYSSLLGSNYGNKVYGIINQDYDQVWPDYVVEKPRLRFHVSRPTRNESPRNIRGLPATAKFIINELVPMYKEMQEWIHAMCWSYSPNLTELEAKNSWKSAMANDRFITNYSGNWTNADYINGTLLNKEPMKLEPTGTAGTLLNIIGETRIAGEDCWEFKTINSSEDYTLYNPEDNEDLFYRPNNSVRIEIWKNNNGIIVPENTPNSQWTGTWRENRSELFPQYENQLRIPLITKNRSSNFIQKWRARILQPGEPIPNPTVD